MTPIAASRRRARASGLALDRVVVVFMAELHTDQLVCCQVQIRDYLWVILRVAGRCSAVAVGIPPRRLPLRLEYSLLHLRRELRPKAIGRAEEIRLRKRLNGRFWQDSLQISLISRVCAQKPRKSKDLKTSIEAR
jgi:hypothetical protein